MSEFERKITLKIEMVKKDIERIEKRPAGEARDKELAALRERLARYESGKP